MPKNQTKHKIQRQLFEVKFPKSCDENQLQADVSRMFRERLLPVIEKVFDEISPSGTLLCIKSLDINLGEIPLEKPYNIKIDKFEASFKQKVSSAIRNSNLTHLGDGNHFKTPPETGALVTSASLNHSEDQSSFAQAGRSVGNNWEQFCTFMETGVLPWWGDVTDPGIIKEAFTSLLEQQPALFKQQVTKWYKYPLLRKRMVAHLDDEHLFGLTGLFLPEQIIQELRKLRKGQLSSNKMLWWEIIWIQIVKSNLIDTKAKDTRFEEQSFIHQIRVNLQRNSKTNTPADKGTLEMGPSSGKHTSNISLPRNEQENQQSDINEGKTPLQENNNYHNLPSGSIQYRLGNIPGETTNKETVFNKIKQSHTRNKDNHPDTNISEDTTQEINKHKPAKLSENNLYQAECICNQVIEATIEQAFLSHHQVTEYYLNNSGLVIIWPFYTWFFKQLGLIREEVFVDEEARHKAACLMQAVASGIPGTVEYMLPLNKLLCGIPLNEPIDGLNELTNEDMADCNTLLQAVIEQVEILNNMSTCGFRGSFLLREGVLKSRDGQWHLYVKGETYDVVLERFPWPFNFVKLPWMQQLLYVEW